MRAFPAAEASTAPVDVSAMVDPQNDHGGIIVVDLVDNSVGTPTRRP
jgi:hypothetical protein